MYKFIEDNRNINKVDIMYVEELEKRYNITFPNILKEYYLKYNGARIKLCLINVYDYEYGIHQIFELNTSEFSFEYKIENDRMDFISKDFIPFAYDQGGNDLYWDNKTGKIYIVYWDHFEEPAYICDSFEELFKLMEDSCE